MRSAEALFNESHWEIRIPNARIDSLQEGYKTIIQAKPRTHVFYDETVLFYLQVSLPDDLSTLHEDTERQVREFFQAFEIQVEAAYVDAVALAVASSSQSRSPNGTRSRSGTQTQIQDKRSLSISSPGYGARQHDQSRVESTMMYSYTYNPSEHGKEVEIRPVNGLWTAIFPFAVPVSFVKTKSTNIVLMLSAHVLLRPVDQTVPESVPLDEQYNLECFSMVNLLEGLSDDPNFATSIVPQHHYRPDTPRARVQASPNAPVLRRNVRRTIAVRSALNLRMRTTRVSPLDNPLIMSIEVENNSEHGAKFKMTQVDVDVTHAAVASLDTAELTKLPLILQSSDRITFLFSVSLLDNPEWDAADGSTASQTRPSTDNPLQESSTLDIQRQVTIILQGVPELDGVQGQTIQSRWNCFFDISDLTKHDHAGISDSGPSSGSARKHIHAPQASHPSGLLPPQHLFPGGAPSSPGNPYFRAPSLPPSPQPPFPFQKNASLVRLVSNGSPPVFQTRHTNSGSVDSRAGQQQLRGGAPGNSGRRSGHGGWGQGLTPVQEGLGHRSPMHNSHAAEGSDAGSYDEETPQASHRGSRTVMNANAMSPGLDLAAQALNGIMNGRPEYDNGDGIVVSFAVTDRVVVGKIFNLEIFIVNRSHQVRRYTLVVPNRKRTKGGDPSQGSKVLPPLPSGERALVESVPIDPYMEETELLRRHVDNETTEADIICLENNVRLSPLYPLTCQNLNLRFIAIKEQLHTIDLVQLVDNETGFVTNLRNCLCFMAEASFGALSQQVPDVGK
ncbi:TRAPP trafficking subunit Trs65-domain-containing protein [Mortierella sp. GBAus27b]|nr:TRAPP trafficking subunit Trs65-domain-containing protein [Mortierella sp. GBAus27b]